MTKSERICGATGCTNPIPPKNRKWCSEGCGRRETARKPERRKRKSEVARARRADDLEAARERDRLYRQANAERVQAIQRRWREGNREVLREAGRRYYHENAERSREYAKRWAEENADRLRERKRNWNAAHPEKLREYSLRRRALVVQADGDCTAEQWQARFDYYGNVCAYCGTDEGKLELEHVIPLSRGGSHWPANLRPACRRCNRAKWTKTLPEWRAQDAAAA